jgi:bifunctional ADP-heptose synthase (sugar kinase/adenylyltransferase)
MKKFIVITFASLSFAIVLSLMAFSSNENNAAANQQYILLEIYEVPSYPDRGIHIHYGGNKREFIPFKSMEVEDHDDAGDAVLSAINKLVADGYQIESTAAGLSQAGMITKVFMRKK